MDKIDLTTAKTDLGVEAWLAAGVRGLHPVRLLLCLAGATLSLWSAQLAQGILLPESAELQLATLAEGLQRHSLIGSVVRGGLLLSANLAWWSLLGAWVARHELLAQRASRDRDRPGALPDRRGELCPTGLVRGWWPQLWLSFVLVLVVIVLLLVPAVIAWELLANLGGVGALTVAVLLPVVLAASVLLVFAAAVPAWPLMPVVIAAECSDYFDAISRAYMYFWSGVGESGLRLLTGVLAFGVPIGLAVLVSEIGPELSADWSAETRQAGLLATAAVVASLFWSLQAVLYLDQRAAVEGTDVRELADDSLTPQAKPDEATESAGPAGSAESAAKANAAKAETPPTPLSVLWLLQYALLAAAAWLLTYVLLSWGGAAHADWLAWGLGEEFVPSVSGELRQVASWIAAGWAAVLAVVLPLRKWLRPTTAAAPPRSE